MRTVALDVHKRFAEVAVHEDGVVRRLGRIETRAAAGVRGVAGADRSCGVGVDGDDVGDRGAAGRHAGRVTVSNPMRTRAIASAKVKTDKIDAKVLAQLGAADFLPGSGRRIRSTRALRRRVAHRSSLVVQRTGCATRSTPCLTRNLIEPPVTDVFGQGGRRWLGQVELPAHEREQIDSDPASARRAGRRDRARRTRSSPQQALADPRVRRLMTIPGVGAITALATDRGDRRRDQVP